MPKCVYHHICGLMAEANPSECLCILHSRQVNKDAEAFDNALVVHRETRGDCFTGMVFPTWVDFARTPFSTVSFRDVTFAAGADFTNATFSAEVEFSSATFAEKADFINTVFSARTSFVSATFAGDADFTGTAFAGEVSFGSATFAEKAIFMRAAFAEKAAFSRATFALASFTDATFAAGANFAGTTFAEAHFMETTFAAGANFSSTTFAERATFASAIFSMGALFIGAHFSPRGVTFRRSRFSGRTLFAPLQTATLFVPKDNRIFGTAIERWIFVTS